MVICPKCQTQNRSGARFCVNCAAPLPVTTQPLDEALAASLASGGNPGSGNPAAGNASSGGQSKPLKTEPLGGKTPFAPRPIGSVIAERFVVRSLLYNDERQNRYLVSQLNLPLEQQVRRCPNPQCGAIFAPGQCGVEKFCTDCGTPLGPPVDNLVVWEVGFPIPNNLQQLVNLCLAHPGLRPPLAFFEERVGGLQYYDLLLPDVPPLERQPEPQEALEWAVPLANALDYLHANGVGFNGRIDASCFGMADGRLVWSNFAACAITVDGTGLDLQSDVRALVTLIYNWLGGSKHTAAAVPLAPPLQQVFDQAFQGPGFATAAEFSQALQAAMEKVALSARVDFQVGRRTDVGMVRSLNEDSILVLELNRVLQSVSQPLGVFVVADGMGGHAAGEVASGAIVNAVAQKALAELFPQQREASASSDRRDWLRGAVEYANQVVLDLRKSAGTDMGSTMVAAVIEGSTAYVTHVGDSRVYLISSQGIRQLTVDHSLVERLVATNQITREEARRHPQRNVIYRTIGDKAKLELEVTVHRLKPGDQLLLCSDGMSGMVEDQTIYRIVSSASSPQQACDDLIAAANQAGGDDNISVIIVKMIPA